MTIILTNKQRKAKESVFDWFYKSENQVFKLFGLAGTGKTTIISQIVREIEGYIAYGAFTGKAASVMRSKGIHAKTIHSLIYKRIDEEESNGDPIFVLDRDSILKHASLVVLDECSMISPDMAKDLLSFKKKILVIGDPGQLPPIEGDSFFSSNPDFLLTEILRQAKDNPILNLALDAREGKKIKSYAGRDSRLKILKKLDNKTILNADQILVGKNQTRRNLNRGIRKILGRNDHLPEMGDKIICLKNCPKLGLYNGTTAEVISQPERLEFGVKCRIKTDEGFDTIVKIHEQEFEYYIRNNVSWKDWPKWSRKSFIPFDYSYAITVHKFQGSQAENVIVFDEGDIFKKESARWRYTAFTRATESLIVRLT